MRPLTAAVLLSALMTLPACRHPEPAAGTAGPFQAGMARAEGSTPYAAGRTSQDHRAGLSSVTVAASRQEGALDTSGSGTAELARRSAAATQRGPAQPAGWFNEAGEVQGLRPEQVHLNRIRVALSSATAGEAHILAPVSIQTLNNLRARFDGPVLVVFGRVSTLAEKNAIERVARQLEGVEVDTQLEMTQTLPDQADESP